MFLVIRYAEGNPMEVTAYESATEAINAYQTTELDKWVSEAHLVALDEGQGTSSRVRYYADGEESEWIQ